MLSRLRQYVNGPQLDVAQATSFLRQVFLIVFMSQFTVAMATGLVLRALFPAPTGGDSLLGWVLVLISVPHLPMSLALAVRGLQGANRGSSLSSTLLVAVLLSTPAWFLSLGFATGQADGPLFTLMAIMVGQYAIGMFLTGRFARLAIPARKEPEAEGEAGAEPD